MSYGKIENDKCWNCGSQEFIDIIEVAGLDDIREKVKGDKDIIYYGCYATCKNCGIGCMVAIKK